MTEQLDAILQEEPNEWINILPKFQQKSINYLLLNGSSLEDVAEAWLSASTENTYRFSSQPVVKGEFLKNIKKEVISFLCNTKYEKDRKKIYEEDNITRQFIINSIAEVISSHIGIAAPVIYPVIAIVISKLWKDNYWCFLRYLLQRQFIK